jgi:hypothetical protein
MRKSIILLILFLMPLSASAQFKAQTKPIPFTEHLKSGQKGSFGILGIDPSRFSMQHSYSMSYASMAGHGFTQGLYLNTMTYQFAMPLTVSLQLGMAHNPFESTNTPSMLQNGIFVSGAQVRYQPTKNTVFQFNFQQRPYQNSAGYYGMYDNNMDWFE